MSDAWRRTVGRSSLFVAILTAGSAGCNASLPDPDSPGARLYVERCNGCHRLYAPGLMTFEMWTLTVKRMQGEMERRGGVPLDLTEEQILLDYMRAHSLTTQRQADS